MSVVRKEKQRSGSSQIFHFNSSEVKSVVSVVRGFILIVVKVKQCSEHSQRFLFDNSEVKQGSE